jgi:hypothetical protein
MIIENKFNIGQIVYLVTDEDQKARLITGLKVCANRSIEYLISCGTAETYHYAIEISENKNLFELKPIKDESGNSK